MSWDTFWGAFLGFVLAAVLEFVVSIIRRQVNKHNSLKALIEELWDLEQSIDEALATSEDSKIEIIIPSWEAIVQTGNILLFTSKDYFKELMETYLQIKELIECEEKNDTNGKLQSRKETKSIINELKKYPKLKKYFSVVPKRQDTRNKKKVNDVLKG